MPPALTATSNTPAVIVSTVAGVVAAGEIASTVTVGKVVEPFVAVAAANAADVSHHVGNIFTSDFFYSPDSAIFETLAKYNIYGVEMEAAGIFAIAAEYNIDALAICTVSDDIITGNALTADERATTFDDMILVALDTAIAVS